VYSIANRQSFQNVEIWVKDITDKARGNILLAIVGNKSDLANEREVTKEEGELVAKKHHAKVFIETSAKDGVNIDEMFEQVGREILAKMGRSTKA
jgi:Ras-related protein Rab-6A